MIRGLMAHSQFADYYRFIGLTEYADFHERRYKDESCAWRRLSKYAIEHCGRLLAPGEVGDPGIIPRDWYDATRDNVMLSTVKSAVERGMSAWVEWETETKRLYEEKIAQLTAEGHIATADMLKQYLCDVDDELAEAKLWQMRKRLIGYDPVDALKEQDR